jgi:flagellar basal body rod protein FlgG
MNTGLYSGAAAMRAAERQLDVVAHNLANVDTVGYKRQGTAAHAFRVPTAVGEKKGLGTLQTVDWSQGNLLRTGNVYDVALFGDGFLALDTPRGEVYTRGGQLQVDQSGVLMSGEGYPLVWDKQTGLIDPAGMPVVIDGEGQVMQGERELGRLRVVDFRDYRGLRQDGDGYWTAPAGARRKAHSAAVHQGALEQSNASSIEDVVAMVTIQRSFEAASNVMSMINESYTRLTRAGG